MQCLHEPTTKNGLTYTYSKYKINFNTMERKDYITYQFNENFLLKSLQNTTVPDHPVSQPSISFVLNSFWDSCEIPLTWERCFHIVIILFSVLSNLYWSKCINGVLFSTYRTFESSSVRTEIVLNDIIIP
jgi:hypothetical protein